MYKIKLNDGTVLENLELNGNNYISENVVEDSVFAGNLSTVVISNGETEETFTDMKLVSNRVENGKSWFILCEKTEQEKATERLYATLMQNSTNITDMQMALAELSILIASTVPVTE